MKVEMNNTIELLLKQQKEQEEQLKKGRIWKLMK